MACVSDLIRNQSGGLGSDDVVASLQPLVDAGMGRYLACAGAGRFYCDQVASLYQDAGRKLYTDEELAAGFLEYLRQCVLEYNSSHRDGGALPLPGGLTLQQKADLYLASRGDLVRVSRLYDDGTPEGKEAFYFRPRGASRMPRCEAVLGLSNAEMVRFFSAAGGGDFEGFSSFLAVLEASAPRESLFADPGRAFLYWVSQKGLWMDEALLPVTFLFTQYQAWMAAWGHCAEGFDVQDEGSLVTALCRYGVPVGEASASELGMSMAGQWECPPDGPGLCMRFNLSREMFHLPGSVLDTKL